MRPIFVLNSYLKHSMRPRARFVSIRSLFCALVVSLDNEVLNFSGVCSHNLQNTRHLNPLHSVFPHFESHAWAAQQVTNDLVIHLDVADFQLVVPLSRIEFDLSEEFMDAPPHDAKIILFS